MRLLTAELYKLLAYRWPILLLAGTLAACTLLDACLALGYAVSATSYVGTALGFTETVCRLAWFVLPVLVLAGDVREGTLSTVVLVRPAPRAVLAAKLGAALIAAQVSTVCAVGATMALVPLGGWPDTTAALVAGVQPALRLLALPPLAVCFGFSFAVLTGLRWLPWVALGLVAWTQVVEKILFTLVASLTGVGLGAALSPYNTAVLWLYRGWDVFNLPALNTWGFLPMLVLTTLGCAAAATLVTRTADPAGRPWGLRTVALDASPAVPVAAAPGPGAVAGTSGSGATHTDVAPGAGTPGSGVATRQADAAPGARTTAASGAAPSYPSRDGFLADTLAWLSASLRSPYALRQAVALIILCATINTVGSVSFAAMVDSSLTPSGTFASIEDMRAGAAALWTMFCLALTVVAGSWCYLRLTYSRELALVYTALPRRSAVVTACSVHAALLAAATALVSVAAGLAALAVTTSPGAVLTPPLLGLLATAPLTCALAQVVVVGAAVLIRRPIPALAGTAAWLLLAEHLLDHVPGVGEWLSSHSLNALTSTLVMPEESTLSATSAIAWLAALAGLALTAAVVVEKRRPGVIGV